MWEVFKGIRRLFRCMIYNYLKYFYSQFIRKDNKIYKIPGKNSYLIKNEILDNPKYKKHFPRDLRGKGYIIRHTIIPEKTWKINFKVGTTKDIEDYIRLEEITDYMRSFRSNVIEWFFVRLDSLDSEKEEDNLMDLMSLLRNRTTISTNKDELIYYLEDFGIKLVEGTDSFMYYIKLDDDYERLKNRIYEIITKKISQEEIDYYMKIFKCLENLFALKIYSDIIKMESNIRYILGEEK